MAKSLTREDLIYILNQALKFSEDENNALELREDGMYVEKHDVHSTIEKIHVPTEEVYDIISLLTVDGHGRLMYNGEPSTIIISDREGNAIQIDSDNGGLYVKEIPAAVQTHLVNNDIHITALERETWNSILATAKGYTDQTFAALRIQHITYVTEMPPEEEADPLTIYVCADENTAEDATMWMLVNGHLIHLNITKATLNKYYTKTEADTKFLTKDQATAGYLPNTNAENLQAIRNDNGHPVFQNKRFLSQRANNGLTCDEDGGLYFPDVEAEVRSLALCATLCKTNLLDKELTEPNKYYLKDHIGNYAMILIEYYYKPSAETVIDDVPPTKGYAKTAIVDPDTMEWLYDHGIDYCLEVGYGVSNMNTKIYMHGDQIWVNYYHDICIFKITGLSKDYPVNDLDNLPPEEDQEGGGE